MEAWNNFLKYLLKHKNIFFGLGLMFLRVFLSLQLDTIGSFVKITQLQLSFTVYICMVYEFI